MRLCEYHSRYGFYGEEKKLGAQPQQSRAYPVAILAYIQVEVEVKLRLTVAQSVLVSGTHLGHATNFLSL
jgi:hypothetical protein